MAVVSAENRVAAPSFPPAREATPEDGLAMLDRRARRYLGISGEEFLRRWRAGDYAADPDQTGVMEVATLLPFVQGHVQGDARE
ncbi:MAG: hypothetical protein ACRDI2_24550 [Chloroflexota bacterium]